MSYFGRLIGDGPAMQQVQRYIDKAASAAISVLISGETGTGKELVAREIHARSARCRGPFVAVNTGVLTPELVASELFGHTKGAFTGAADKKIGRFVEADGGTLFLDEITTMDDAAQVALLRVLESGEVRPVGAKTAQKVDVRLITATNKNLREAVLEQQFREDLMHRLRVFTIMLPPLRERTGDIPILVEHFVRGFQEEFGFAAMEVAPRTMDAIQAYPWVGNVRELKNAIAQAVVMADGAVIEPEHLPQRLLAGALEAREQEAITALTSSEDDVKATFSRDPVFDSGNGTMALSEQEGVFVPMGLTLEEVQQAYVLKVLAWCDNNKTHAAQQLGISRRTLYDRLRRWQSEVRTVID